MLSIMPAISIESTTSDMRMLNSNNVVFKWSNDRNIGNRDKMLRLCCGKV